MYIPDYYKETNTKKLLEIIEKYPFATMVSVNDEKSYITHLPFIADVAENGKITLFSHLSKVNNHWENWNNSTRTTIIFNGPHAYISPTNYLSRQNVPTWNYIAVHAHGTPEILNQEGFADCLRKTIDFFEPAYMEQMNELPEKYFAGMLNGIVAFKIEVENIEGKFKLSQNKKPEEIENIISSFSTAENSLLKELAAYMQAEKNALADR